MSSGGGVGSSSPNYSDTDVMTAPPWHEEGPMPTISDSLFSLIILIYVGVIFVFMFFSFCWKEPELPAPDPCETKGIPMITEIMAEEERKKEEAEAALAAAAAAAAKEKNNLLDPESAAEMHEMQEKPLIDAPDANKPKNGEKIVVNVITEKTAAAAAAPPSSGAAALNKITEEETAATQV